MREDFIGIDTKRTTQVIGYLLKMSDGRQNKLKLIKLIWAADRYHIRNYGRTITRTEYFAMPYGPVNSLADNIVSMNTSFLSLAQADYVDDYLAVRDTYDIVLKDSTLGEEYLSDSDKEALDFAFNTFGKIEKYKLAKIISHKYPEWFKHKDVEVNQTSRLMNFEDFFENPDNDEYFSMDEDRLNIIKEEYMESLMIKESLGF